MTIFNWQEHEGDLYVEFGDGSANVYLLRDGLWRWKAHSDNDFDMDGWWGNAKNAEEAKTYAENYLKQYER